MGGVNLDDIETGLIGADGGGAKGQHDRSDACVIELVRLWVVRGKRDGAGRQDVGPASSFRRDNAFPAPGAEGARLPPGVGELDSGARALGTQESRDAGQGRDVLVLPQAEVLRADAALGRNGGRLSED